MPSNHTKRRLSDLGIFVLPVVLVKIAGTFLGTGSPSDASAAPTPVALDAIQQFAHVTTNYTEEQLELVEYISQLEQEEFGQTPMYYEPAEELPEILISEDPILMELPPPTMVIQAIISSSQGATALINGKVYRVGDEVDESGWTVIEINADSRSLVIKENDSERTETVSVNRGP